MKNADFFNLGLPKWPCLLVSGSPVTIEQAAEIIIRTDSWQFMSNDRRLEAELKAAAGFPPENHTPGALKEWQAIFAKEQAVRDEHGVLPLQYLHNSQIVSCYIGGPHGWCDWQGNIGCNSYNIGKWPSVEEVYKEWKTIAKAFPFLDLRCQLLSGEQCEDNLKPVVEFIVKGGKVRMAMPQGFLRPAEDIMENPETMIRSLNMPSRQRESGCTLLRFKEALRITKASLAVLS